MLELAKEIGIQPDEIEKVYRIGEWDPKATRLRPVICVFYEELRRTKYYMSRLRFPPIFKQVKINKQELSMY